MICDAVCCCDCMMVCMCGRFIVEDWKDGRLDSRRIRGDRGGEVEKGVRSGGAEETGGGAQEIDE